MHAHSQRTNAFLYGNVYADDVANTDRQLLLPRLMAEVADDFDLNATNLNADAHKAGTSRRYDEETLEVRKITFKILRTLATLLGRRGETATYTLEVSMFSRSTDSVAGQQVQSDSESRSQQNRNRTNNLNGSRPLFQPYMESDCRLNIKYCFKYVLNTDFLLGENLVKSIGLYSQVAMGERVFNMNTSQLSDVNIRYTRRPTTTPKGGRKKITASQSSLNRESDASTNL
jgi:hypothetical protein